MIFIVSPQPTKRPEIKKEEKDIYYADDAHGSWKAVKKIAENMRFFSR